MEIIGAIIGYAIIGWYFFMVFAALFIMWKLFKVSLNTPIFKETIEITFESKDDEDKKDD